jgi:hypothetical protein
VEKNLSSEATVAQIVKKFTAFMGPEGSLLSLDNILSGIDIQTPYFRLNIHPVA